MAIPLTQLNTWSGQGAVTSSAAAYASIQHALTISTSPVAGLSLDIFLQGSYANDTNIYGDSDIDVVVLFGNTFHKDMTLLTPAQQTLHEQIFPAATYTWHHLQADVLAALRAHYGGDAVQVGRKSIKVNTGRGRPADVVPAVQFRKYATFNAANDLSAHWGIHFFDSAGAAVVNYPKYHIERGIAKNRDERTRGQYKTVVRIFKNLRNRMVERGVLEEGVAPSYFIECALHNVPDQLFVGQFNEVVPAIIGHLAQAQRPDLMCQNGVTKLIGPASTQWSPEAYGVFVTAIRNAWNNW